MDKSDVVSGVMRCAKCKFVLHRVNLHVSDGGVSAGGNHSEPCPNGCGPLWPMTWQQQAEELMERCEAAVVEARSFREESERLAALLNTPELHDFASGVVREAAHQRERWGDEHDAGKTPDDWLWTLAFLATKAAQAERYGDRDKYLHHIMTAGALLANWHAHALAAMPEGAE